LEIELGDELALNNKRWIQQKLGKEDIGKKGLFYIFRNKR